MAVSTLLVAIFNKASRLPSKSAGSGGECCWTEGVLNSASKDDKSVLANVNEFQKVDFVHLDVVFSLKTLHPDEQNNFLEYPYLDD